MKTNIIPFRLRKRVDDDIKLRLEMLPKGTDRSEVIRAALRAYFNQGSGGIKIVIPQTPQAHRKP